jgi:hypothetical protein
MVIFKVPNCAIALFIKVHIYSREYYHRRINILQNILKNCGVKGCWHINILFI